MIQEIIDNYKKHMEDEGWTLIVAANKIHISVSHLSRIFHGERTPSIALLKRMEDVMKNGESFKL